MVFVASPQVSWIFQLSSPPTLCFPFFYLSPPPPPIWLSLLPGSSFSFNLIVKNWIQSYKILQIQLLWKRSFRKRMDISAYNQHSFEGTLPTCHRCSMKVTWGIWMPETFVCLSVLGGLTYTNTVLGPRGKQRTKQSPHSHGIYSLLKRQKQMNTPWY